MASFLSKLFKPKWQNSSVEVRKNAIADLDPSNNEHQQILTRLMVDDSAASVRQAALKRLADPATIIKHYSELKQEDRAYALEVTSEQVKQLGLNLFDLIQDDQLLAEIIIASESQIDFMNGLARLQNEQALFAIASKANLSRVRQAATELIETEQHLQQVMEIARSKDKNVFQIAKSKLTAMRERKKQIEAQQAHLQTLLGSLKEHANTEDTNLYSAKLDNLTQKWQNLAGVASEENNTEYQALLAQCATRAKQLAEQSQARATTNTASEKSSADESEDIISSEETSSAEASELSGTLRTLNDTLEQLRKNPASARDVSAIDAIIKTQETRWIESTKETKIDKATEKTYQTTMGDLRRYHTALQKLTQNSASLEASVNAESEDGREHITKLLARINWPEGFAKPDLIEQARQLVADSKANKEVEEQRQRELEQQYHASLEKLDAMLEEKQLSASKKQMQAVRKLYNEMDKRHQNKCAASLKLRNAQLNELRDWQGFAASPKQERLCEAMEQLAEQHLDPQEKALKIKTLQEQWKALGGSQDQALWERFSAAADKAFEPCAEFYAEQGQLKEANLAKREKLLSELSAFVEQNNWEKPDWKAVEKINRQARQEWRDAYPVDHKKSRPLQEKFNVVLEQLDEKLNTERARNLALKQEIVNRAENLTHHEDLNSAMQGAKELQNEWQQVGITDHKKDRALWKAFRKSCDAIFEKRDNARTKAKEAENAQKDAAKAALVAAKDLALNEFANSSEAEAALTTLRKEVKQLNDLPAKEKGRYFDEYDKLIAHVKTQLKILGFEQIVDKWQEAQRKAQIAFNAFSAGNTAEHKDDFASKIDLGKALESSFKTLWQNLDKSKAGLSDQNAVKELCIRCEVAAGVSSPEEDQERRMQLQVSRLSEGLSSSGYQTREEQLETLLTEWYAEMLIDNQMRNAYESRIKQCIAAVFGAPQKAALEKANSEPA